MLICAKTVNTKLVTAVDLMKSIQIKHVNNLINSKAICLTNLFMRRNKLMFLPEP